jgi:hypothetical protein
MFSYWLVIGLIVVATIVSVMYIYLARTRWGYEALDIPVGEVYLIGKIVDPQVPDKPALLMAYREEYQQEPWKLQQMLEKKLLAKYPDHRIEPVHVTKEPGYNSYRIMLKQKEWAKSTYKNMRTSLFHMLSLPVELILRWMYLPIWTVIDFVSQDRKVAVALVVPPDLAVPDAKRSEEADISVIESYGQLYFRANAPEVDGVPIESGKSSFVGQSNVPPWQIDYELDSPMKGIRAPDGPSDLPLPLWASGPDKDLSDAPTIQWAEHWQRTSGLAEECKESPLYTYGRNEVPAAVRGESCPSLAMEDCTVQTPVYPSSRLTRRVGCRGGNLPSSPARWKNCTTLEQTMRAGFGY